MKEYCLTIAGSDPSSGAGIQADIRTFEECGVYGFSAITAITFQSANEFHGYKSLSEYLEEQLISILKYYPVKHVKIGMIPDIASVYIISEYLKKHDLIAVLDPVTVASTGSRLSEYGLETQLSKNLFPKVKVITPNFKEALFFANKESSMKNHYSLVEIKQLSIDLLMKLYPNEQFTDTEKAVLIKSAYEDVNKVYDVVCFSKLNQRRELELNHMFFVKQKVNLNGNVHGTGCILSSALAAYLSKNQSLEKSIQLAEDFFNEVFQNIIILPDDGKVIDVSNLQGKCALKSQIGMIYNHLSQNPEFSILIPEVRMNISGALPNATTKDEIAGFDGRITIVNGYPKACGEIKFGASNHTARLLLTAKTYDPSIKFVSNIKYHSEWIDKLRSQSELSLHEIIRGEQPKTIKNEEQSTMQWIIKQSYDENKKIPDIIWDKGEHGKEPMLRLFSKTHEEMIQKLQTILDCVK